MRTVGTSCRGTVQPSALGDEGSDETGDGFGRGVGAELLGPRVAFGGVYPDLPEDAAFQAAGSSGSQPT